MASPHQLIPRPLSPLSPNSPAFTDPFSPIQDAPSQPPPLYANYGIAPNQWVPESLSPRRRASSAYSQDEEDQRLPIQSPASPIRGCQDSQAEIFAIHSPSPERRGAVGGSSSGEERFYACLSRRESLWEEHSWLADALQSFHFSDDNAQEPRKMDTIHRARSCRRQRSVAPSPEPENYATLEESKPGVRFEQPRGLGKIEKLLGGLPGMEHGKKKNRPSNGTTRLLKELGFDEL